MLINNPTDDNKGKIKGHLHLEDKFGFCKSFRKVIRNLSFHIIFKTVSLKNKINTSMADDKDVTINMLYLYVRNPIASVETQLLFNKATQNNYKISYDESYTKRRVLSDMIDQHDMGSVQQVKKPQFLIFDHQTRDRVETPFKNNNIAILDNQDFQKIYVEIDGLRYPRDGVCINYEENE